MVLKDRKKIATGRVNGPNVSGTAWGRRCRADHQSIGVAAARCGYSNSRANSSLALGLSREARHSV